MYGTTVLILLAVPVDSVAAQTSSFPYAVSPTSVPLSQAQDWCSAQESTCLLLCGGSTSSNECSTNDFSYSCTCANGVTPDCPMYASTLPTFECQLYQAQCLTNASSDTAAQQACNSIPCGTTAPSAIAGEESSSPTTASIPSSETPSPSSAAPSSSSPTTSSAPSSGSGSGSSSSSSSNTTSQNNPSPNFDFSYIQKSVNSIGQALSADGLTTGSFPKDVDIICENCTGKGYIGAQLSNGGDGAEDFFEHGAIDLVFAGITTNMSLDVELQSGFSPFKGFYAFYNYTTPSLAIGNDFNLSVVAKIGIPFQIQLDSPVSFYGGFVFTLPDEAIVTIAVGENGGVTTSGFESATISALPFGYDAAGLTFSVITGLQIQISLVAINTGTSDFVNASGTVGVNINIPQANITFAALENVNSLCKSPMGHDKVFKYAADVTSTLEGGLNMTGAVKVGSFKWSPPSGLPSLGWTVDLPSECLYSDSSNSIDAFGATVDPTDPASVAAGGAGNSAASSSANGSGSGGSGSGGSGSGGSGSGGSGSGGSGSGGSGSSSSGSGSTDGAVQESVAGYLVVARSDTALWTFALCVGTFFYLV